MRCVCLNWLQKQYHAKSMNKRNRCLYAKSICMKMIAIVRVSDYRICRLKKGQILLNGEENINI